MIVAVGIVSIDIPPPVGGFPAKVPGGRSCRNWSMSPLKLLLMLKKKRFIYDISLYVIKCRFQKKTEINKYNIT